MISKICQTKKESIMSSWFKEETPLESYTPPKKSSGSGGGNSTKVWEFFLKRGESSKIVFLNADDEPVPVLDYHQLQHEGKTVKVACLKPKREVCPFCNFTDVQEDSQKWKTKVKKAHCFSILDDRGNKNDKGEKYPPQKKLRFSSEFDKKALKKLRDTIVNSEEGFFADIDSLQYTWISVLRPDEDKTAAIGEPGQAVGVLNPETYEGSLEPLSQEEILEHFITDDETIQAIAENYQIESEEIQINE